MRKRSTFCRPVSSVRLSVTFVYYIQTAKDVKLLYNSGSLVLLFIFEPKNDQIRRDNARGDGFDFQQRHSS